MQSCIIKVQDISWLPLYFQSQDICCSCIYAIPVQA